MYFFLLNGKPSGFLYNPPANLSHPSYEHFSKFLPLLRIRIRRIHMFLGLLDPDPYPDPLVRGTDPDQDPSIIKQK